MIPHRKDTRKLLVWRSKVNDVLPVCDEFISALKMATVHLFETTVSTYDSILYHNHHRENLKYLTLFQAVCKC